jgi:2-phosphosulfolactate phosphatase
VRVHVAFTPAEAAAAPVGIVVDVIRATSSIAQALASGYERVLCCREIDEARALRVELGDDAVVGGERNAVILDGFDVGASPREFAQGARARTLVLTTTNGTRAIVTAAQHADRVVIGSLLNLISCGAHVARKAREAQGDVLVQCAGVRGEFTIDDAYVAGRYVEELGVWLAEWERSDAAVAAVALAMVIALLVLRGVPDMVRGRVAAAAA